jgi:hypothetical protein
MKASLVAFIASFWLAGCPLQPDVVYDSGITPDSGSTDDGGMDDGGMATGTISASLATTSIPSGVPVVWTGSNDLAFSQQNILGGTASIRGDSLSAGHIVIQLTNLQAGTTSGVWLLVSYSTPQSNQAWSCSVGSSLCSAVVGVSGYDGRTLSGTFSVQFNQATIGTDIAALSNGTFSVSFF